MTLKRYYGFNSYLFPQIIPILSLNIMENRVLEEWGEGDVILFSHCFSDHLSFGRVLDFII